MAEGTKLADAYVQIIPVSEGITERIRSLFADLPDEGSRTGEDTGRSLGNSIKNALIATGLTAAIGKIIKSSFSEGAALEQSLGGVETLFKQHADIVKKNAQDAYKTAGLSANEYMENVTGFSASLLQGLGGDTEKAAKIADIAMIDMSDNANKFGTDMQSIQYAYQGFAKNNYTMLDNLKLGYGGTKTEMERLLADAEKLSGHKYDISNFSDVINAIHDVQENLGIMGTTSKEADETFSGSFKSMKSAAKNLLGDMSTGMGDIDEDVKNLSKTAKTFVFDNALPMLGNIVESIDDITDGLGPVKPLLMGVAAGLAAVKLANCIPNITLNTGSLIGVLVNAEMKAKSLAATLSANKFAIYSAGAVTAAMAIKMFFDKQTEAMQVAFDNYDSLNEEQKKLVDGAEELSKTIADNAAARASNKAELEGEIGASRNMIDRLYELNDAEYITNDQKKEMQSLVESLNDSIPELNLTLDEQTGHLQNQRSEVDKLIDSYEEEARAAANQEILKDLYKDLYDASKMQNEVEEERIAAKEILADLQNQVNEKEKEYNKLAEEALNASILSDAAEKRDKVKAEYESLTAQLKEQENVVGELSARYFDMSSATRTVQGEIDGLSAEMSGAGEIVRTLGESFAPTGEMLINFASGIDTMTGSLSNANQAAYDMSEDVLDQVKDVAQAYQDAYDAQYDAVYGSLDLFSEFSGGTSISAQEMIDNLNSNKEGVEQWSDNLKELARRGVSDGLLKELQEAGPSSASKVKAMTDMTDDQLEYYSQTWDETASSCRKIVNEQMSGMYADTAYQVSKLIGIPYGEAESMREAYRLLGECGAEGMAEGFRRSMWLVAEAGSGLADMAERAVRERLGVESPSKVFKEIGGYTSEGFALGITAESDAASKASVNMVKSAIESANKANNSAAITAIRQQTAVSSTAVPADTDSSMKYAFLEALAEYGSVVNNSAPKQPLNVTLVTDKHVLGRAVVEDINQTTKLNGRSPLL